MAGDNGSEFENGNEPKPEAIKTAGNSDSDRRPAISGAFREAIDRA